MTQAANDIRSLERNLFIPVLIMSQVLNKNKFMWVQAPGSAAAILSGRHIAESHFA